MVGGEEAELEDKAGDRRPRPAAASPERIEARLRDEHALLQKLTEELTQYLAIATSEKEKTSEQTNDLRSKLIAFFADGDLEQVRLGRSPCCSFRTPSCLPFTRLFL